MKKKHHAALIELEVVPPEQPDNDDLLSRVDTLTNTAVVLSRDTRVAAVNGAFRELYDRTAKELADEYQEQEKLAAAAVRVAKKTTELMKAGLQSALDDLDKQIERLQK